MSRFARLWVVSMVGVVCLGVGGSVSKARAGTARPEGDRPPNFIFLLVDDWGWTDAGCFGSDLYETPNIDRLAAGGTRFTDAYAACTVCSPTRAAVMTGMYPARLHVTDFIPGHAQPHARLKIPDWTMRLEHRHVTLAEALEAAGYVTAHVGKWHLAPRDTVKRFVEDRDYFPAKQGFQIEVAGTCYPGTYYYPYRKGGYDAGVAEGAKPGQYLTDRLTDEALRIIEQNRAGPFFLYFAYFNVHTPVEGRPDLVEHYKGRLKPGLRHTHPDYAAMVTAVDESVGRIMDTLDRLELAGRTVVFLTGDNGGLDRRDGWPTDNYPLREGKGSAYEGGVRVPGIVRAPGLTGPGSVCREPIISVDYYPTVLELAGIAGDAKHNANVDGTSLVPVLTDPDASLRRDAIFWHYPHYHAGGAIPHSAIRADNWRLIEFHHDMHVELYSLEDDIGEANDLAHSLPDRAATLRGKLHQWRTEVGAQMPVPNPDHRPPSEQPPRK